MKKQTTTLLILAAAGAAAYFFMKKKNGSDTTKFVDDQAPETDASGGDVNAVVTAAPGQIQAAVEKATEIAANIKDAVVAVSDGSQTAIVTSGKAKRDARRLERQARMAARKSAREAKRLARQEKRAIKRKRKGGQFTQEQINQYCTNTGVEPGTRAFKKCVRQARKKVSLPLVQETM